MNQQFTYIYGLHALEEALSNAPQSIVKIYLDAEKSHATSKLAEMAKSNDIPIGLIERGRLPQGADATAVHQGAIAQLDPKKLMKSYDSFVETLEVTPHTCLIILGEIQDPQNVGAIIRSAAAFGTAAILFPEHNQVQVTGTVAKVSAGMAFRLPLISIPNVNTAVRDLKKRGFWIYGLDETAEHSISKEKFDAPTVFILGNEATGIREKTRELCDILLKIEMNKQCESLNVAASAAVTLHSWSLQHPEVLG